MDKTKLLLVEDDIDFGNMLSQYLSLHNFEVKLARTGQEGWLSYKSDEYNFCILDVMLPDIEGFTLAEKIKAKDPAIPIVFLTAKALKEDKIKGLQLGADDYITKPFEPDELILRIKNILNRYNLNKSTKLKLSHTTLDCDLLKLNCPGAETLLTPKEMELIKFLMNKANKTVQREEVLKEVWGEEDYFVGRSMDVFITRIRKYLSSDKGLYLRTIRGKGYILESS